MNMPYAGQNAAAGEPQQKFPRGGAAGSWDLITVGAVVGFVGGVASVLFGSLLTAAGWFTGGYLKLAGTAALLMTIPLLVFGAYCMDVLEGRKKRARKARFEDGK